MGSRVSAIHRFGMTGRDVTAFMLVRIPYLWLLDSNPVVDPWLLSRSPVHMPVVFSRMSIAFASPFRSTCGRSWQRLSRIRKVGSLENQRMGYRLISGYFESY